MAGFLRPGERFHLAEGHPTALVFDDMAGTQDGRPGWFAPYFDRKPVVLEDPTDYADSAARLQHALTHTWIHPLGNVLGALRGAGLALEWLQERPRVTWRMFRCLVRDADGLFTWPERPRLALAYSLVTRKPAAPAADGHGRRSNTSV